MQLFPDYPISPRGALARAAIPIYNLYGVWKIIKTMSDQVAPDIGWLTNIAFSYPLMFLLVRLMFNSGFPEWLTGLVWLIFPTLWFIIVLKVQRALAELAGKPALFDTPALQVLPVATGAMTVPESFPSADHELPSNKPVPFAPDRSAGVTAAYYSSPKRRGMSRGIMIGLVIAALTACGIFTVGAIYVPRVIKGILAFQEEWYDESYDQLNDALWKRWGPDDSIPYASGDFYFRKYGNSPSEVWFVIDLQTTIPCTINKVGDPCEALAHEFGRIVLENYPKVDQLDGLQVSVTHYTSTGVVELSHGVDVSESIPEWRRMLGIVAGAEDV